jgi:PTH1 family peptidyl-tRNA hydrolase
MPAGWCWTSSHGCEGGSWRSKFSGQLSETRLDGARLALVKPETYMNESGKSPIAAAARFFKAPVDAVLVVHDDVDLEEGRLQARLGGGLAGHNGLRSIAQGLGSHEFLRLRIGVGRPGRGDRRSVAELRAGAVRAGDRRRRFWFARSADAVETIVRDGLKAAQQRYN